MERLVLLSRHPTESRDFYSLLGAEFVQVAIDKGGSYFTAKLSDTEIAIYSDEGAEPTARPNVQIGFAVKNLAEIITLITEKGRGQILMDPTSMRDGLKAILLDPDGRAVELRQSE